MVFSLMMNTLNFIDKFQYSLGNDDHAVIFTRLGPPNDRRRR